MISIFKRKSREKLDNNRINVTIFSREKIEELLKQGSLQNNLAVISFYDNPMIVDDPYCVPVNYPNNIPVFFSQTDDIAYEFLAVRGYSEETYFQDDVEMAKFILSCVNKGIKNFYCQCEFGQSRSSAVAAAITEFYNKDGIEIFSNHQFSPNKIIYRKLFNALKMQNFLIAINF